MAEPMRFGSVKRDWSGQGCFLVCGGDSLSGFDFERIRAPGVRVVVVNSSYLVVPWADALVFGDWKWFDDFKGNGHAQRPELWKFAGEKIAAAKVIDERLTVIRRIAHNGISDNCQLLMAGATTVSTALNFLWLKRVRWVGVLGLDGKPGQDGRLWHHEPHPAAWPRIENCFRVHGYELAKVAKQMAERGVEVFNCNPDSAHRMFPFASPEQLLGKVWQ